MCNTFDCRVNDSVESVTLSCRLAQKKHHTCMRYVYLIGWLLLPFATNGQTLFPTRSAAMKALDSGYVATKTGWVIKTGDTLLLGKGTLPGGGYTYIYENPARMALSTNYGPGYTGTRTVYLKNASPGQKLIIKKWGASGVRSTGFTPYAVVGAGLVYNYWVEIDNAISSGEIQVPEKYQPAPANSVLVVPVSVADELRKLKSLLDDGLLSKEEYETQRKKILNQ